MEIEFIKEKIPYEREKPFNVHYEDHILKHRFDADFIIYNTIIPEAKATTFVHWDNFRQTLNYLKASQNIEMGIIINFVPIS
jgi:GxxExxY protein